MKIYKNIQEVLHEKHSVRGDLNRLAIKIYLIR